MQAECNAESVEFHPLGRREVVGRFDGGKITSEGGGLLLREVEEKRRIIKQFTGCFRDFRDPDRIEHPLFRLVAQRVYALAMGYEDINDHEDLRQDPLLAVLVGSEDPLGRRRVRESDQGKALAGKSTLNRLELTPADADGKSRYKKISVVHKAVEEFFVRVFLQAHHEPPKEIVLDLDATDDPLHGNQEGRFFHGYYNSYCYLPLYIFCGEHLLWAQLRSSNIDASEGSVEALEKIVGWIRQDWPEVKVLVRGDSGFCRERIMSWCEGNGVDYVLGLAKNSRLTGALERELDEAKAQYKETGRPSRLFKDFSYRTLKSWSRKRRVVGKAEHLEKGSNPRFVVTSLSSQECEGRRLYEEVYCARGEMENRIKEQQLHLFADRTSCHEMRANQLRLWFSSVAYVLMETLRRLGLTGTQMARAQCQTIRLKLLKIGAQIRVTSRKVWISWAEGYPYARILLQACSNLKGVVPLRL